VCLPKKTLENKLRQLTTSHAWGAKTPIIMNFGLLCGLLTLSVEQIFALIGHGFLFFNVLKMAISYT
jgi:hypothetical protein